MSRAGDYRVDDNTIAKVGQGIVLERTGRIRLRGNLFDGVDDGVVADSASSDLAAYRQRLPLGPALVHRCAGARRGRQLLGGGRAPDQVAAETARAGSLLQPFRRAAGGGVLALEQRLPPRRSAGGP